MTSFRPCLGCSERVGCEIKAGVLTALKKQPVSSVRLKCKLPFTKHFPPGTRVQVGVWDWRDFFGSEISPPRKDVPATVVGQSTKKRDKVLMILDAKIMFADEVETEFVTAYTKDLVRLDEPSREVCDSCGRALVHDTCGCQEGYYRP
ncbi:hypothetical protein MA20_42630 [Bradyrhizobium japonicum]|uniref:Uncharacterized protein n=1 Tax=Bradyrhizobium japonicum TaxID=375 RepID=A0A0A3YIY6_BRAJP|nr:hypothetical protein [Bradyrhizobium japonicum]KGT73658.1 hypothetical protein MA20_42630 [Bradyrhizobium japonicum]